MSDAILITLRPSGVLHLLYNRPKNLNAMTYEMSSRMGNVLHEAAKDDRVKAVVISGTGRFFCSGSDVSGVPPVIAPGEKPKHYIEELIAFPKLLVAGVNGPAIGIGVTMLPLFDLVWSVESATFKVPFAELGICAEACSSITFPRILGPALTARLIYLAETVPAAELVPSGFLTAILPTPNFEDQVLSRVDDIVTRLSVISIITSKSLVRDEAQKKSMIELSRKELALVDGLRQGPDFKKAMKGFADKAAARAAQKAAAGSKL